MYAQFPDPRIAKWQARLARVPRWGWIAFFVGVMVPVLALAVAIVFIAVTTGAIVMAAVLVAGTLLAVIHRLFHRRGDGRKNVQIIVGSARVIDP